MFARGGFHTNAAESAGLPTDRLPKDETEVARAEEAITQALEKISIHEREKYIFELHGIDTTGPNDDPSTVQARLKEVDLEIFNIRENKAAYERARKLNRAFVDDKAFQLMFLRAVNFDAGQAAQLLVYHFQTKMELFGNGEVLARDVRLTDLSPDDIACVKTGLIQVCPARDIAGRTILNVIIKYKKFRHVDNLNRAMWYIVMCALKDEETQKKGVILVFQNYGDEAAKLSVFRSVRRVQTALPKRTCGVHFCFTNPLLWPAVAGFRLFLWRSFLFRAHFGKPDEIGFELQTFGIPPEGFPSEDPGVEWHHEWLRLQQMREEAESDVPVIVIPRRFDVLFGKSKKAREHTGTLRCQYLVEMMRGQYEQASRQEKTVVADQIIKSFFLFSIGLLR